MNREEMIEDWRRAWTGEDETPVITPDRLRKMDSSGTLLRDPRILPPEGKEEELQVNYPNV